MPVPSLNAWSVTAVRVVIALCAFTLLATSFVHTAAPASGADLGAAISSGRRSQQFYEKTMLRQDRTVIRTGVKIKKNRRVFKRSRKGIKRAERLLRLSKANIRAKEARLEKILGEFPSIEESPKPWQYERRIKEARTNLSRATFRHRDNGRRLRKLIRGRKARLVRIRALKRQRRIAIGRREAAEGRLAAYIVRMTSLAASRANLQSTVKLTAGGGSFSWPSVGRISQTYGCTGFYINPRRGSCRHFHDGLDIVAAHGSPVRAAAVGVVAYEGWNPWDQSGRAFIVVVAHPDGFVTRYGHLLATKKVRAGQVVHTGQPIGKMGNTGRSTGTHVHFELLKGGSDVNPLSYLPSGGNKIVIDKKSTRKGVAKAARKARAKARAAARKQAKRERKAARRAARAASATKRAAANSSECDETTAVVESPGQVAEVIFAFTASGARVGETADAAPPCDPEASSTDVEPAAEDAPAGERGQRADPPPGVRLPFRGTSPIPE